MAVLQDMMDDENDDILQEEDIAVEIQILPGLSMTSGYQNHEINLLSQKLMRIAFCLCLFQILLAIISVIIEFNLSSVFSSFVNIILYLLIYYLAYICIKYKNQPMCCGCTPLTIYVIYLYISTFILTIILIANLVVVISGLYWRLIHLLIVSILFGLNIAEIYYSKKLSRILHSQVHPIQMNQVAREQEIVQSF